MYLDADTRIAKLLHPPQKVCYAQLLKFQGTFKESNIFCIYLFINNIYKAYHLQPNVL